MIRRPNRIKCLWVFMSWCFGWRVADGTGLAAPFLIDGCRASFGQIDEIDFTLFREAILRVIVGGIAEDLVTVPHFFERDLVVTEEGQGIAGEVP